MAARLELIFWVTQAPTVTAGLMCPPEMCPTAETMTAMTNPVARPVVTSPDPGKLKPPMMAAPPPTKTSASGPTNSTSAFCQRLYSISNRPLTRCPAKGSGGDGGSVKYGGTLPWEHARSGLRRKAVRLPAPQGSVRPELRGGHARHPLLHRLHPADGTAGGRRRWGQDRAREDREAAGVRGAGHARLAEGRARTPRAGRRRFDRMAATHLPDGRSRRGAHRYRIDRGHGRQHRGVRGRRGALHAGERRRRAAALQLHRARHRATPAARHRHLDRRPLAGPGETHET